MNSFGASSPNESFPWCDTSLDSALQLVQQQNRQPGVLPVTMFQHVNGEFYHCRIEASARTPKYKATQFDINNLAEHLFGNASRIMNTNGQGQSSSGVLHGSTCGFGSECLVTDCANVDTIHPQFRHFPSSACACFLEMPTLELVASNMEAITQMPLQSTISASTTPHRYNCLVPNCLKNYATKGDLERHVWSHGPPHFLCPVPDCKYRERGFHRKDHLIKHLGTHNVPEAWMEAAKAIKPKKWPSMALQLLGL